MRKIFKIIFGITLVIFLILALSPIISLILPQKLKNHTYYRLVYQVIADHETSGTNRDPDRVFKLFNYVVRHEFLQGIPYSCKPFESLVYGEGFCDFQARTLNALLDAIGIKSRYAMLLKKDSISPHTLNEVFLGDKWCVMDTSYNIIYKDNEGKYISLEELSVRPELSVYGALTPDIFPLPQPPLRSEPYQAHILDYIARAYLKVLGRGFFNFYQDIYLGLQKYKPRQDDLRLFFDARNYHLSHRYDLVLEKYNRLLKDYPDSKYRGDVVFFCGMLYFDLKDYQKSADFFKQVIEKYPKWAKAAEFYLNIISGEDQ